ncbi:MAG: hypothetical protein K5882_12585 [Bacteroidales bacterium]|nr:hypothetical protein [Bacteroidales bacterium]
MLSTYKSFEKKTEKTHKRVGNTLPICKLYSSQSEEKTHKKLTSITDSNNPPDTAGRSACHSKQLRLPQQAEASACARGGTNLVKQKKQVPTGRQILLFRWKKVDSPPRKV